MTSKVYKLSIMSKYDENTSFFNEVPSLRIHNKENRVYYIDKFKKKLRITESFLKGKTIYSQKHHT